MEKSLEASQGGSGFAVEDSDGDGEEKSKRKANYFQYFREKNRIELQSVSNTGSSGSFSDEEGGSDRGGRGKVGLSDLSEKVYANLQR